MSRETSNDMSTFDHAQDVRYTVERLALCGVDAESMTANRCLVSLSLQRDGETVAEIHLQPEQVQRLEKWLRLALRDAGERKSV